MDQRNVNEDQLKYLGKPISDINSLGNIFSEEELKIINMIPLGSSIMA